MIRNLSFYVRKEKLNTVQLHSLDKHEIKLLLLIF